MYVPVLGCGSFSLEEYRVQSEQLTRGSDETLLDESEMTSLIREIIRCTSLVHRQRNELEIYWQHHAQSLIPTLFFSG